MLDSKVLLAKDKRIFKSVMGTELNVTFRPYIISILTSEYVKLQQEATEAIKAYVDLGDKAKGEDVDTFQEATKKFTSCGIKIILATLRANGQESTEEWLQEHISLDEFDLLVNYIIGTVQEEPSTKKK